MFVLYVNCSVKIPIYHQEFCNCLISICNLSYSISGLPKATQLNYEKKR